jgi:hypothetical protein
MMIIKHRVISTAAKSYCSKCDTHFETEAMKLKHQREEHGDSIKTALGVIKRNEGFFICPSCSRNYKNANSFRSHSCVRSRSASSKAKSNQTPQESTERRSNSVPTPPLDHPVSSTLNLLPPSTPIPPVTSSSISTFQDDLLPPSLISTLSPAHLLTIPPEFEEIQLGIDQNHHMVVCIGHGCAIQRDHIISQFEKFHGGVKQLPSDLYDVLDRYQVPSTVKHPCKTVAPVPTIPILSGFFCTFEGCDYVSTSHRSAVHNHVYVVHKGFEDSSRFIEPCEVQHVFKSNPPQFWHVNSALSSQSANEEDVNAIIEAMMSEDMQAFNDGLVHMPSNPRELSPFFTKFNWLTIVDGKSHRELTDFVQLPEKEGGLLSALPKRIEEFFAHWKQMVQYCSPSIRKWVNTNKG